HERHAVQPALERVAPCAGERAVGREDAHRALGVGVEVDPAGGVDCDAAVRVAETLTLGQRPEAFDPFVDEAPGGKAYGARSRGILTRERDAEGCNGEDERAHGSP